jgi:hypothetical protein
MVAMIPRLPEIIDPSDSWIRRNIDALRPGFLLGIDSWAHRGLDPEESRNP